MRRAGEAARRTAEDPVLGGTWRAAEALGLAGRGVLVAVSGGVDSSVLAHALRELAQAFGLAVSVGHVNHGLRGAESDADEAAVSELARSLDVPFATARVDPGAARIGRSSRARPTLQEAARDARYAALRGLCGEVSASRIATAHTADDQAETVLLRLLRGCGPDGLGGIPDVSADGVVVRPLLCVSRAHILAYAERHRIPWREDSSNRSVRYARNRLRRDWLPGLARDFNPQLLRTLGNLAEAQRRDQEWIDSLVAAEATRIFRTEENALWIDPEVWDSLPEALARRLARSALRNLGAGRDVTRAHLERMLEFLRHPDPSEGRVLELPQGLRLDRTAAGFRLRRVEANPSC